MATIVAARAPDPAAAASLAGGQPNTANLSTTQTGTGQSTNVVDRGTSTGPVLLKLTTTVGATPTVTIAIEGSADGTNWLNVPYAASGTPTTVAVANVVITSATTNYYYIQPNVPVRYLRLTYSANTNVTTTADVWVT